MMGVSFWSKCYHRCICTTVRERAGSAGPTAHVANQPASYTRAWHSVEPAVCKQSRHDPVLLSHTSMYIGAAFGCIVVPVARRRLQMLLKRARGTEPSASGFIVGDPGPPPIGSHCQKCWAVMGVQPLGTAGHCAVSSAFSSALPSAHMLCS
jgi:hypothetical protein